MFKIDRRSTVFRFPCIFDLQLRDRRLADPPSTEPTLCQSDWLTVTSICGVALNRHAWNFILMRELPF